MAVYFIRAGENGPVKIGVAVDIPRRMAVMQSGNHLPLKLIREMDGSYMEESWLHRYFREAHVRGEWFEYRDAMLTVEVGDTLSCGHANIAGRIIDYCGGYHRLALALKIDVSNVYRFTYPKDRGGTGGSIPLQHMQTLLKKFPSLKPDDFFDLGQSA